MRGDESHGGRAVGWCPIAQSFCGGRRTILYTLRSLDVPGWAVIKLLRPGKHVEEPGRQGGAAEGPAPRGMEDHGDPWLIFSWGLSCTWEGRDSLVAGRPGPRP